MPEPVRPPTEATNQSPGQGQLIMKKFRGLYDAFIESLNSIYYEGYAEQIRQENPELFAFEWEQFQESLS